MYYQTIQLVHNGSVSTVQYVSDEPHAGVRVLNALDRIMDDFGITSVGPATKFRIIA